jgi:hypothetical protein
LETARLDQTRFQATPSQHLPLQEHYIGYEHLVDNLDRVYCYPDASEKLVIGGAIFALDKQRRAE